MYIGMSTDNAIGFGVWDGWINKALGDVGLATVESKNNEWARFD
jgi:hypothetical protein